MRRARTAVIATLAVIGLIAAATWAVQIYRHNAEASNERQQLADSQQAFREIETQLATSTTAPPVTTTTTTMPERSAPTTQASTTTSSAPTTTPPTTTTLPAPPALSYLPAGELIGALDVPRLGKTILNPGSAEEQDDRLPIRQGTADDLEQGSLSGGVSKLVDSNLPGTGGTFVIGGHRTSETRPFYALDTMQLGDDIFVTTTWGVRYHYVVELVEQEIPKAEFYCTVESLAECQTPGGFAETFVGRVHSSSLYEGMDPGERLVLYSCTPIGSTSHRVVVVAKLVASEAL